MNLPQPGLDGRCSAGEEAVRAEVQRGRLCAGKISSHCAWGGRSHEKSRDQIWKLANLMKLTHSFSQKTCKNYLSNLI